MTKRKTNLWTKVLFVSLGIILLMSVASNALTIGAKLGNTWTYYSL